MTAITEWGGEIEIAIGLARTWPSGEWDFSEWDQAEWDETDTALGDWLDVTCDTLVPIFFKAGSSKVEGVVTRWESATATISFVGASYDPRVGPWADRLGPGLPIRVRWRPVTVGAVAAVESLDLPKADADWRTIFLGDVVNGGYEWEPSTMTATVQCWDRTSNLVAYDNLPFEPAVGADEWASARIHRLADMAYVPLDERDITVGGVSLLPSKLSGTVWSNMLAVADTDLALLWVRRDGRLAFRPEGRVAENVPVNACLVACPEDMPGPTPPPGPVLIFSDGFEMAIGTWTPASANLVAALDPTVFRSGARSLKTTRANSAGIFQIFARTQVQTNRTAVTPGEVIRRSGWVRHDSAVGTTIRLVARYNLGAAGLVDVNGPLVTVPPNTWTYLEFVDAVPPGIDNTTWVANSGTNLAIGQSVWVDDAYLERIPAVASPNLLPSDKWASMEDGATTGWVIAQATGVNTTEAADAGSRSIALTPNNTGPYLQAGLFPEAVPVTPGAFYTFLASVRPDLAGRTCLLGIVWWTAAGAATFDFGPSVNLGAAGAWTRLRRVATVPATAARATILVSPRGLATTGGERAMIDRLGVFKGNASTEQWALPSYVPPAPRTPIGYVDLVDTDPHVLRNWVTTARRKLEGAGATEPVVVTRVDGASVSRFRPQTFRKVDLENSRDDWSATVADAILADGAWPTTAPQSVELDTRVHQEPTRIAALLLDVEPEHVFWVQDPIDRDVEWRMIPRGWDVEVSPEKVTGSLLLDDITGWGSSAGWDDPAPPHGWDVDTWALVGSGSGGGGGSGGLPATVLLPLSGEVAVTPAGALTVLPLLNPGTGHPANSFTLQPGTYSLNGQVTFQRDTGLGVVPHPIRAGISINGVQQAVGNGTSSTSASVAVPVAIATLVVTASTLLEFTAQSDTYPSRAIAGTQLSITQTA